MRMSQPSVCLLRCAVLRLYITRYDTLPMVDDITSCFSAKSAPTSSSFSSSVSGWAHRGMPGKFYKTISEKGLDLMTTMPVRRRLSAIKLIIEKNPDALRKPTTTHEWQLVNDTYTTLQSLSRDSFFASFGRTVTKLVEDIVQITAPQSLVHVSSTHAQFITLLAYLRASERRDGRIEGDALSSTSSQDREITQDHVDREFTILILGVTGTVKSSLLKHIQNILREQGSRDLKYYRESVISHVIDTMKMVIREKEAEEVVTPLDMSHSNLLADAQLSVMTLSSRVLHLLIHRNTSLLTFKLEEARRAICTLCSTPSVQQIVHQLAHKGGHVYNVDSVKHFLNANSVNRIFAPDYVPTREDIQLIKRSDVRESILDYGSSTWRIIEPPWTRSRFMNEIHYLGKAAAIFFAVDLMDYDNPTSMNESLALFESIANYRWSTQTVLVLVFGNHKEFSERLAYSPLKYWDPEYQGETYESACEFIQCRYLDLVKDRKNPILAHHVCNTSGLAGSASLFGEHRLCERIS
ncbi:hypothetical protein K439DRAFT_1410626 [Ramaria rubella]|nr:hypothetical protein K439DRAFT_1410626 [Ramaria rubella]